MPAALPARWRAQRRPRGAFVSRPSANPFSADWLLLSGQNQPRPAATAIRQSPVPPAPPVQRRCHHLRHNAAPPPAHRVLRQSPARNHPDRPQPAPAAAAPIPDHAQQRSSARLPPVPLVPKPPFQSLAPMRCDHHPPPVLSDQPAAQAGSSPLSQPPTGQSGPQAFHLSYPQPCASRRSSDAAGPQLPDGRPPVRQPQPQNPDPAPAAIAGPPRHNPKVPSSPYH